MACDRFDRNIRLFGKEGQDLIRSERVAVVGVSGLGTHVVQQLALLGVGELSLIDHEELETSNRNRYVGVRHDDPVPGTLKVETGVRLVAGIDPDIKVRRVAKKLVTRSAFEEVKASTLIFGCLDRDGPRLVLNELCAAYFIPYVDLASEVLPGDPPEYGGRVCVSRDGDGCLYCLGLLNLTEAQADLDPEGVPQARDEIYGVHQDDLGDAGPSVVSVNGVVASLGVTEFMVTGIRMPRRLLNYRGDLGTVTVSGDPPRPNCFYCKEIRGKGNGANVERYLAEEHEDK